MITRERACEEAAHRARLEADVRSPHELNHEELELLVINVAVAAG